jgi:hypothetical protein
MTNYPLVDPMRFLVDEEVRPFSYDKRQDLTAAGVPILSTGVFVVNEIVVPENEVFVIMGVAPHLWARTDPLAASSTLIPLPSDTAGMGAGQGWWLFNYLRGGQQPFVAQTDYNKPRLQAAANNNDRFVADGTTWLPGSLAMPSYAQFGFANALTPIVCQPQVVFQVTFQLAPTATASPLPNPFTIGSGANRIDCAGANVFGLSMPKALYDKFTTARRDGLLGAEAG